MYLNRLMVGVKLTMAFSYGFEPIGAEKPKLLILGSMPGQASLEAHQYYAHPRNAFWPIMADILAIDINDSYSERCEALAVAGVMVWDVIAHCEREGSLDSSIKGNALQVNDFTFLQEACEIAVLCNGGKAYELFVKQVVKPLAITNSVYKLPSTSPAYAAKTLQSKKADWNEVFVQELSS